MEVKSRRLSFLLQLVAINQRLEALVERELAREHVPARGYALLSAIGAFGPLTLTEVSELLGMPVTTASDAVKRLAARGVVARRRHPDDGRAVLLELTPAGDEEWRRGWPGLRRANAAIARHLAVDADEARALLVEIDAALAAALEQD
ncbi:MAG: MarR family winged helix-turn-helix transcriptional regulator [Gaiellaceae bacterium]